LVCDEPGQVDLALAAQALENDRRALERALPVRVAAVEVARAAAVPCRRELAQGRLELRARRRVQRREDLVHLPGPRGLAERDRVAVAERRRARRARLDVDEEVAVEEDARPDLHRRVR